MALSDDERNDLARIEAFLTAEEPLLAYRMSRLKRSVALRNAGPVVIALLGVALTVLGAGVGSDVLAMSGLTITVGCGILRAVR
ncbi:DUF3040 domain-containing protein [Streptomyces sp. HNM0575]|uniref:DUF3040 domain-containing protein n=1 Tax=Streptomyces sp. HNM0575 TaxID=2716338 RepID=UPI00145D56C5|nr:DUF3040 domain-containing protein [Streptomyces sp. HNM0575]NLU76683.1 DUF3040 domain-containing protein [Streptomyces sp. HNM0575]